MKELDNAGVPKSKCDTTLLNSSICSHSAHIPGLITVIFEVSGDKSTLSVSGVTVTV